MIDNARMEIETERSLRRLMPRMEERFGDQIGAATTFSTTSNKFWRWQPRPGWNGLTN
jgi:hypothetical protein